MKELRRMMIKFQCSGYGFEGLNYLDNQMLEKMIEEKSIKRKLGLFLGYVLIQEGIEKEETKINTNKKKNKQQGEEENVRRAERIDQCDSKLVK